MDLSHWTTPAVGAASAIAGIFWLLAKLYFNFKALQRSDRIADAEADVEVAKAQAEATRIRQSRPDTGSGSGKG